MHIPTAVILPVLLLTLPSVSYSQDIFRAGESGQGVESRVPSTANTAELPMITMPDSTRTDYGLGNAPLHVNLVSYSQYLYGFYKRGNQRFLESEAEAIGVSIVDLEYVIITLRQFATLDDNRLEEDLMEICRPILTGEKEISNESARETIASFDDRESVKGAIAREILNEISSNLGNTVSDNVLARITEFGKNVEYSQINMVEFVRNLPNMDHKTYLTNQCSNL